MKSSITMSVIALAAAFVLTGCGPKEEGNLAGTSSTNANVAGVITNAPTRGMGTNTMASTNMPMDTNMSMTTNMSGMTNMSTNMSGTNMP